MSPINPLNLPFLASIEETHGKSRLHGFHLGTDEALARKICAELYHGRIAAGLPVVTVALMKPAGMQRCIVDVYAGTWGDDDIALLFSDCN